MGLAVRGSRANEGSESDAAANEVTVLSARIIAQESLENCFALFEYIESDLTLFYCPQDAPDAANIGCCARIPLRAVNAIRPRGGDRELRVQKFDNFFLFRGVGDVYAVD